MSLLADMRRPIIVCRIRFYNTALRVQASNDKLACLAQIPTVEIKNRRQMVHFSSTALSPATGRTSHFLGTAFLDPRGGSWFLVPGSCRYLTCSLLQLQVHEEVLPHYSSSCIRSSIIEHMYFSKSLAGRLFLGIRFPVVNSYIYREFIPFYDTTTAFQQLHLIYNCNSTCCFC